MLNLADLYEDRAMSFWNENIESENKSGFGILGGAGIAVGGRSHGAGTDAVYEGCAGRAQVSYPNVGYFSLPREAGKRFIASR